MIKVSHKTQPAATGGGTGTSTGVEAPKMSVPWSLEEEEAIVRLYAKYSTTAAKQAKGFKGVWGMIRNDKDEGHIFEANGRSNTDIKNKKSNMDAKRQRI